MIISTIIIYVLGAGGKDQSSLRDSNTKDIDMQSKHRIKFKLFDFGGIPFLLWVWFFDSQVACHPLPAWAAVLAPSLVE